MPQATRVIDRIQDQADFLGPVVDGDFLQWSNAQGKFIMAAGGGGSGTVTSVAVTVPSQMTIAGSPITTSGTLAFDWATENAGLIFAGPSSGAAAKPTFRALAASDIPPLSYVASVGLVMPSQFSVSQPITGSGNLVVGWNKENPNTILAGPTNPLLGPQAPTFRALVASDIPPLPYVASVGLGTNVGFITISGSPVTSSGTLTETWSNQSGNVVLASPANGGLGVPAFRTLVAGDIPALPYVTSVAMTVPSFLTIGGSPITSSGTLALDLATENANLVFAGPTSGGAAKPTFRLLVAADIPALSYVTSVGLSTNVGFITVSGSPVTGSGTLAESWSNQNANLVLAGPSSGGASLPTFRALTLADMPAGLGTGTVSSVGLQMPPQFAITNSPVTTSGTLTVAWANEGANTFLAGPVTPLAGMAPPTFRKMVPADIPALNYISSVNPQPANLVLAGPASGGSQPPSFRLLVAADVPSLPYVSSVGLVMPTQFSVSGPVTGSGNLSASWNNQNANTVLAGPASGGAGAPTFRALVAADIPGSGSVTSVGLQTNASFISISGSPITASGTLQERWQPQKPNCFLSGPQTAMQGNAVPNFRAIVTADLGNVLLGPTQGGTGAQIFTQGSVVFVGANGVYSQNNSQLFWDNVNLQLKVNSILGFASVNIQGANASNVTLTGGNNGGGVTLQGGTAGGTIQILSGVGGTNGGGGPITVTVGASGNNPGSGTQTGPNGSPIQLFAGQGGTAPSAGVASTGGVGGGFSLNGGTGGGAGVSGTATNTGGAGGSITVTGGAGGTASGVTSGTETGGNGGGLTFQAGSGGSAVNGSGTLNGGNGANLTLAGGAGGTGNTANGVGGSIIFQTAANTNLVQALQIFPKGGIAPGNSDPVTYAASMTLDTQKANLKTFTTTAAVGNATINMSDGGSAGQLVAIVYLNDATAVRTITFGSHIIAASTTVQASAVSRHVSLFFVSDGTNWYLINALGLLA